MVFLFRFFRGRDHPRRHIIKELVIFPEECKVIKHGFEGDISMRSDTGTEEIAESSDIIELLSSVYNIP